MPSVATITFCGDTSRWTMLSGAPISSIVVVRGVQAGEHLTARSTTATRTGTCVLASLRRAQQPVQRHAVHVLLDEHDLVAGRHDVEHGHDVAVVDLRRDARLVEEHRDELGVLGELGMQALRGDDAREALVAHQARDVDRRHPAARDLAVQQVAADRDRLVLSARSSRPSFEELDRSCPRSRSRGS